MSTAKLFSFSALIFMFNQQNIASSGTFFISKNKMTMSKREKGIDRLDHWHDNKNNTSAVFAHRETSGYKWIVKHQAKKEMNVTTSLHSVFHTIEMEWKTHATCLKCCLYAIWCLHKWLSMFDFHIISFVCQF